MYKILDTTIIRCLTIHSGFDCVTICLTAGVELRINAHTPQKYLLF